MKQLNSVAVAYIMATGRKPATTISVIDRREIPSSRLLGSYGFFDEKTLELYLFHLYPNEDEHMIGFFVRILGIQVWLNGFNIYIYVYQRLLRCYVFTIG